MTTTLNAKTWLLMFLLELIIIIVFVIVFLIFFKYDRNSLKSSIDQQFKDIMPSIDLKNASVDNLYMWAWSVREECFLKFVIKKESEEEELVIERVEYDEGELPSKTIKANVFFDVNLQRWIDTTMPNERPVPTSDLKTITYTFSVKDLSNDELSTKKLINFLAVDRNENFSYEYENDKLIGKYKTFFPEDLSITICDFTINRYYEYLQIPPTITTSSSSSSTLSTAMWDVYFKRRKKTNNWELEKCPESQVFLNSVCTFYEKHNVKPVDMRKMKFNIHRHNFINIDNNNEKEKHTNWKEDVFLGISEFQIFKHPLIIHITKTFSDKFYPVVDKQNNVISITHDDKITIKLPLICYNACEHNFYIKFNKTIDKLTRIDYNPLPKITDSGEYNFNDEYADINYHHDNKIMARIKKNQTQQPIQAAKYWFLTQHWPPLQNGSNNLVADLTRPYYYYKFSDKKEYKEVLPFIISNDTIYTMDSIIFYRIHSHISEIYNWKKYKENPIKTYYTPQLVPKNLKPNKHGIYPGFNIFVEDKLNMLPSVYKFVIEVNKQTDDVYATMLGGKIILDMLIPKLMFKTALGNYNMSLDKFKNIFDRKRFHQPLNDFNVHVTKIKNKEFNDFVYLNVFDIYNIPINSIESRYIYIDPKEEPDQ
ncbi:metalloprotease-like protein [Glossina pallidipes salivary gland hypertrophy virus]|uniref:Metalloprotease-like protein n=1 Tax=Glossina hytrovirus (isolate Glossina pallidipes/Ethiopia/Seibersdorf/-) TaxID=379529 RepID=A0A0Y0J9V6_GHVS|nr:metalloprotease-like protein [Glossina pallidipes salivary gland hypertrophy virus]